MMFWFSKWFGLQEVTPEQDDEVITVGQTKDGARQGRIEVHSLTWAYVRSWANEQIQDTREKNDVLKLSEKQTAALRGRIRLLKELIELPNREIDIEKDEPEDEY